MKRILYITITTVILSANALTAQDRTDALRWSQYFYEGTARFSAMGGAFGALGGDIASLSVNPAGIGVYRSAEFSLTPYYSITHTNALFTNQQKQSSKFDRGDCNFGYVQPIFWNNTNQGLVSLQLGFALNTMNDYGYNSFAMNKESPNSWLDVLGDKMENNREYFDPDLMKGDDRYNIFEQGDWDALLGWNGSLIKKDSLGFYNVLGLNDVIDQGRYVENRGSNMEYAISFGGNYANSLFFGLTIGIHDISYKRWITHSEDLVQPATTNLSWFDYMQYFETQGNGFNLKFGLLYRATDNLRFGLAVHTPTWINLKDYYQASIESRFNNNGGYNEITPTNEYKYKVSTPARYNLSAAYLFNNIGAVSLDYEYVDYSTIRMKDRYTPRTGNSFNAENNIIKNEFTGVSNVRLGLEIKPVENFALRAGYAFYGSPYKNSIQGGNPTKQSFSFGLGYRFNGYFIDAAYKYTTTQSGLYSIYDNSNTVSEKYNTNQFALTLGFRF